MISTFKVAESLGFKGDIANGRNFCGLATENQAQPVSAEFVAINRRSKTHEAVNSDDSHAC